MSPILDNIDFGKRATEVLLQNVPTVMYKIAERKDAKRDIFFFKKVKQKGKKYISGGIGG